MIRKSLAVLICAVMLAPAIASAQDAKAFLGDWVLTVEGRRGPQERPLTIKDTDGKLSAVLGGGRGGDVTITDVTVKGSDATLKWSQDMQGTAVPVVMTLTLKDGTLTVKQDIAGGQFTAVGHRQEKGLTLVIPTAQMRFDIGGRYEQVRRVSSIVQDRLEDAEPAVGIRRQSRQILQSQAPLTIDLRIDQPRREIAAAPGVGARTHRPLISAGPRPSTA